MFSKIVTVISIFFVLWILSPIIFELLTAISTKTGLTVNKHSFECNKSQLILKQYSKIIGFGVTSETREFLLKDSSSTRLIGDIELGLFPKFNPVSYDFVHQKLENFNPELYGNLYISPNEFSRFEYEEIVKCVQKNNRAINTAIRSWQPKSYAGEALFQINSVIYGERELFTGDIENSIFKFTSPKYPNAQLNVDVSSQALWDAYGGGRRRIAEFDGKNMIIHDLVEVQISDIDFRSASPEDRDRAHIRLKAHLPEILKEFKNFEGKSIIDLFGPITVYRQADYTTQVEKIDIIE